MSDPLGLHITWGTYGMRLHGDERGTVCRAMNAPGEPIVGRDDQWRLEEARLLRHAPVVLSTAQRRVAQAMLIDVCAQTRCACMIGAARGDHVHVLVRSNEAAIDVKGAKTIRTLLKRRLGVELSKRWPRAAGASWWAECGSIKWVWDPTYFENVYEYIERQRI
ncbi:MAG: hypothetical protein GC162_13765 [Planctomycetes bacterium]|nr:hypothetical protein [Planctomycetota bacterium]